MTPTKQIVLATTTQATAPIIANRFIGFDGKQAKAGTAVFGVTPYNADEGDSVVVEVIGIAVVEAGGAITVGAQVTSDAQGCAVTGASHVVGTAVTAATGAGDYIAVLLKG